MNFESFIITVGSHGLMEQGKVEAPFGADVDLSRHIIDRRRPTENWVKDLDPAMLAICGEVARISKAVSILQMALERGASLPRRAFIQRDVANALDLDVGYVCRVVAQLNELGLLENIRGKAVPTFSGERFYKEGYLELCLLISSRNNKRITSQASETSSAVAPDVHSL